MVWGWRLLGLFMVFALLASVSAFAALTASTVDCGGRHASSSNYAIDGSIGGVAGCSSAASSAVMARGGYPGQLYDAKTLQLNASPAAVNETSNCQLSAVAIMTDNTFLPIPATGVIWSSFSWPITSISASGMVTTTNVYQNTAATVNASYQSISAALVLMVLNVNNDDFGIYANDGIPDWWQVQYFGLSNPNAGPLHDPDGDGVDNCHEYVADTNPTNAQSYLHIERLARTAGYATYFQAQTNQSYILYYSTNLGSGKWNQVPAQTRIRTSSGAQALVDTSPAGSQRFYRVATTAWNLRLQSLALFTGWSVSFTSSSNRQYTLYYRTNLIYGGWTNIPAQTAILGSGGVDTLSDASPANIQRFYRLGVQIP